MKDKHETENNCSEERPYNLQLQDEIDYVTLGHHLRDVRKAHPYTQAQISEILGLKPNYYGQYETGARHINLPRLFNSSVKRNALRISCLWGAIRTILLPCQHDRSILRPAKKSTVYWTSAMMNS